MAEKKTTAKTAPAPAVETVENPVNKMIDGLVEKAQAALKEFLTLDQEQIDHIVHEMALAGLDKHQELARMAVEETGRGVYEDKVFKNMFATEYIWHDIKKEKTVGVLDENEMEGYVEVAEPVGVIAGVTPTTNPTSTTLFKSLIAVKTRNPIIFGFHPSAQKCSAEAARIVYEAAVKAGAPEEILYVNKPHIGTDKLKLVVKALREEIQQLGGRFCFETKLTGLLTDGQGRLCGVEAERDGQRERYEAEGVFLGIGHSARDTFAMLQQSGVRMEAKAFAVGLRVEHRRQDIDAAQYREYAGRPELGAADYKLTHQTAAGRGVYTFCMCPGGYVIAAASEAGGLVTNGMSNFARDGVNSNSAVLVTVTPEDYMPGREAYGALAGVAYQRKLEQDAYRLGGSRWAAPVQRLEDFVKNRPSTGWGRIQPSYTGQVQPANLRSILPMPIGEALAEGLLAFDAKLEGFSCPDALLTGVESRSSSPVRICRDEERLQAPGFGGLYPMGEGAGYAGGIMSAAMDGLRCAEAYMEAVGSAE